MFTNLKSALSSILVGGCLLGMNPALAKGDNITQGYHTMDSMGCMLLRECTDGVEQVTNLLDISSQYPNTSSFTPIATEFNNMLSSLSGIGVKVFLADSKYFPPGHRGVYHTVGNNFFLNRAFMHRPGVLMSVMRHEGWHVAQDCMAGSIENKMVAIILPEESVPRLWREITEKTYLSAAVPWEAEATWAGKTEGMTMKALQACADGNMWEVYEPTPMTREWLEENNFLPHIEYDRYDHYHFRDQLRHYHRPQKHNHYHWHPKKDLIHSHKHKHGYSYRHHGISKKHSVEDHKVNGKVHLHIH